MTAPILSDIVDALEASDARLGKDMENLAMWAAQWAAALQKDTGVVQELTYWKALKERCNVATKGPWHRVDGPQSPDYAIIYDADDVLVAHVNKQHDVGNTNIDLIMHAREDISILLGEVERLRALVPAPELLKRMADYADAAFHPSYSITPDDKHASDAQVARDLAQRIEDA